MKFRVTIKWLDGNWLAVVVGQMGFFNIFRYKEYKRAFFWKKYEEDLTPGFVDGYIYNS